MHADPFLIGFTVRRQTRERVSGGPGQPGWRRDWAGSLLLVLTICNAPEMRDAAVAAEPAQGAGFATSGRNILLIVADDLGFEASDLFPVPPNTETVPPPARVPNLKRLAAQGIMFRTAWAAPTCSPMRAMLFTGRYSFRTGVGTPLLPPSRDPGRTVPQLRTSEFSLPEAFRASPAGQQYQLTLIGKWHLTWGINAPIEHGWDAFIGPEPDELGGGLPDYRRWIKVRNGTASLSTVYNTADLTNEAIRGIGRAATSGRPYFIQLAYNAPHSAYHKPPNALHARDWLPETGGDIRQYYRAMIEALDTEIGRLLGKVDLATTTVIFLSDNGTDGRVQATVPSGLDPKDSVYEGGIRIPMFIAGAGVADPGRTIARMVSVVDLYPTILELAGIPITAVIPPGREIDGVSLMPVIANTTMAQVRSYIYAEKFPRVYDRNYQRAIRDSRYALIYREIRSADGSGLAVGREFYDLQSDPLQQTNLLADSLTAEQEQRLASLSDRLGDLLATR
jgi:arylsulfatase A-like enzyme